MEDNHLTGTIPPALAQLTRLDSIFLTNNRSVSHIGTCGILGKVVLSCCESKSHCWNVSVADLPARFQIFQTLYTLALVPTVKGRISVAITCFCAQFQVMSCLYMLVVLQCVQNGSRSVSDVSTAHPCPNNRFSKPYLRHNELLVWSWLRLQWASASQWRVVCFSRPSTSLFACGLGFFAYMFVPHCKVSLTS